MVQEYDLSWRRCYLYLRRVLMSMGGVSCKCQLGLVVGRDCSVLLCPCWSPVCSFCCCWERRFEVSSQSCAFVGALLPALSLFCFTSSEICFRSPYRQGDCVFLVNPPFHIDALPLVWLSVRTLVLSDINEAAPASFSLPSFYSSFSSPFGSYGLTGRLQK